MAGRIFDTPVLEFRLIRVFGKYSVRISEGRRTIMTEIYYGCPQYLQAKTEVYVDKVTTASFQIFPVQHSLIIVYSLRY